MDKFHTDCARRLYCDSVGSGDINTGGYYYFSANKYSISYNANGGSNAPSEQVKTHDFPLTLSNQIPTRFGYNFLGWSESGTSTTASYYPGNTYYANDEVTLYAIWGQIPCTTTTYFTDYALIEYPSEGVYYKFTPTISTSYMMWGLDTVDNSVTIYDIYGNELAFDDDSAGDYQFCLEHYMNSGETYYIYVKAYNSQFTGTIDFAILRGAYISYNANGGYNAPSAHYVYCGKSPSVSGSVPTRSGYTFIGWSTSSTASSAEYQAYDSISADSNKTLYAVWKSNSVTHTHTPGQSATCTTDQICTSCGDVLVAAKGHTAGGWIICEDGSKEQRCLTCGELLATQPAPVVPPIDTPVSGVLGDVNNDGAINQYDYILVKRHYFETRYLTADEEVRADVNRDGKVDQYDYILIARHYFGTYKIG